MFKLVHQQSREVFGSYPSVSDMNRHFSMLSPGRYEVVDQRTKRVLFNVGVRKTVNKMLDITVSFFKG